MPIEGGKAQSVTHPDDSQEHHSQVPQAQSVVHPDDLKGTLRWVLKAFIMANLMGNGESFTIRFVDTLKNPKGIFQVNEGEKKKGKYEGGKGVQTRWRRASRSVGLFLNQGRTGPRGHPLKYGTRGVPEEPQMVWV